MEFINLINYIIAVIFFICYAYQFFYIPVALIKKKSAYDSSQKFNRFAVLIAARNEETVIGNLIYSLKKQNYPEDLIDIYVVADNCTDNTAETAADAGAMVYERYDCSHTGKGYALNYLLDNVENSYDGYIVFDADNLVDPDYVYEINRTFNSGYNIITSYRNTKNYGDNWISAGYGLWFLREAKLLNYPRSVLGISCNISGTGFMFSRKIRTLNNGWNCFLLTEDIEFSAMNIVNEEKIGYCPAAIFYDEQPTGFRQSVKQRMRWVRGFLQVFQKYGSRLVKGIFKGSFSCFDMLMNIAPAAVLSWLSIIINISAAIISITGGRDISGILLSLGQNILNLYLTVFILGLITMISEHSHIHCTTARKIGSLFTFPIFMLTYIPVSMIAVICRPQWAPIRHTRSISIRDI